MAGVGRLSSEMPIVHRYNSEDATPEGIRSQIRAAVDGEWPRLEGRRFKVYGLGDIVTPVTLRQSGYGSAIVAAATAHIRADATADVAILHTQPSLDQLYRQFGWMPVSTFSVVTDESREEMAPHLMAVLLSDPAQQLLGGSSGGVLTLLGDEW